MSSNRYKIVDGKRKRKASRSPDHTQTPPVSTRTRTRTLTLSPLIPPPKSSSSFIRPLPPPSPYVLEPRMRKYFQEPLSDYQLGEKLGQGKFGSVYAARDLRDKIPVAIKFVDNVQDIEAFNLIAIQLAK